MQKLPLPFAAGDAVFARGLRWVVEETTVFPDCVLVQLAAPPDAHQPERRLARLLYPFDRPSALRPTRRICVVTPRQWMNNLQSHLAHLVTHGRLRAAQSAALDIFPFQLEPALALVRGRSARFLLADEVGLGKTIQAGLMLAELQRRGWCERALILAPAGLCQQWADELHRRFQIRAVMFDAPALRRFAAVLPFGVNPWSVEPVAIASIDFVKQPEVLQGLGSLLWDVLIVDEAHQVATAPQRSAAVKTLAHHARHVVLVTATPHTGDETAYRSLCDIGKIERPPADDPLVRFRRSREHVGLNRIRKAHLLRVRPSLDEIEMHRLLADYVKRLWQIARHQDSPAIQLVAMVLSKRAFSSASSLAISIERRLAALSGRVPAPLQAGLPFEDDEESGDAEPLLSTPAFDRIDDEEAALRAILGAAERARADERKVRALARWLRRVNEPAIVFTEYRDTLAMLGRSLEHFRKSVLLHGGMTAPERRGAVDAFNSGAADLLLATDAGSEGLNLQCRCRLVINLELPWNPIRLEQRVGRVDRLGQSRTVHAIHLFAEGTAEETVLANLVRRLQRIRASEIDIAACVINGTEEQLPAATVAAEGPTATVDLEKDAHAEAARLLSARMRSVVRVNAMDETVTPVTILKSRHQQSITFFFRARVVSGSGRLLEEMLVPVCVPCSRSEAAVALPVHFRRRDVRACAEQLLERFGRDASSMAAAHIEKRSRDIASDSREWMARATAREAMLASRAEETDGLLQAGLFDSRSLKYRDNAERHRRALLENSEARVCHLESSSESRLARAPELVLLLVRC